LPEGAAPAALFLKAKESIPMGCDPCFYELGDVWKHVED